MDTQGAWWCGVNMNVAHLIIFCEASKWSAWKREDMLARAARQLVCRYLSYENKHISLIQAQFKSDDSPWLNPLLLPAAHPDLCHVELHCAYEHHDNDTAQGDVAHSALRVPRDLVQRLSMDEGRHSNYI